MGNNDSDVIQFIHGLRYEDLPQSVIAHARRCILDLCGVAVGGTTTELSRIIRNHAEANFASNSRSVRMMFDGRRVSLPGAALAGGMTIDSLDAHDGHVLTKGHVGVTVLPVLLALSDAGYIQDDREFVTALVLGYEIATRAGIALHASACDYHTSGAWNALAAAAMSARALALSPAETREALGIAEYHGPRSQMMRCIDHPTMVKDGSGWGAMAGIDAALLAQDGFTGAPALTIEDVALADLWGDLGQRWTILEQYFKAYPVCRWAQPAVEAAMSVVREHGIRSEDIRIVKVISFHQACRLATREPGTTEQAQYSLPFSVSILLSRGVLGTEEVSGDALRDAEALRLSKAIELHESELYNSRFPSERWAHVEIELFDGSTLKSAPHTARGDPETALTDAEIDRKFVQLASPVLHQARIDAIRDCVMSLGQADGRLGPLLDVMLRPVSA